jgi:prepilin-type N-terminal cleavage/methylation domain-containing protein
MRRRAFTIVELLVVIGIIAALLALLLPSLRRARESSRSVGCASNVRQVTQAMMMYAVDNTDMLPTSSNIGLAWASNQPGWISYFYPSGSSGTDIDFTHGAFMKYLGSVDIRQRALRCVEADQGTANYSYVLPAQLGDPGAALVRVTQLKNPSDKIILIEMNGVTTRFDGHFNIGESGPDGDEPADHHMKTRATGYGNHGFADGHVQSLSRADVDDVNHRNRFDYFH